MALFTPDRPAQTDPAPVTASAELLDHGAKPAKPVAYNYARSITASAEPIRLTNRDAGEEIRLRTGVSRPWQELTWRCFDRVGEVQFAYTLVADVISRIRIHAAVNVNSNEPPTQITDSVKITDTQGQDHGTPGGIPVKLAVLAQRLMDEFQSRSNMPGMLKTFALNILTPGECYLARLDDRWGVYSTSELRVDPGGNLQRYASAAIQGAPKNIGKKVPIGRIWQQHPRFSRDPNSGLRSAIDDCMELILLSQMIRGIARSQLNAGLLFIPDTLGKAAATPGAEDLDDPDSLGEDAQQEQDAFEKELQLAIEAAITDESAASTAVPTIVRGPSEDGSKILHVSLARQADQFLVERADKVLGRILNALSAPKDKVTGMAHVKYCVPPDHEALTRDRGWVGPDGLRIGDEILTLNHETGQSEWQPALGVNVFEVQNEQMLRIVNGSHNSLSTVGHRWPIFKSGRRVADSRRRWTTSDAGFAAADRIQIAADHVGLPDSAKWSDAFVQLVALYASDGWLETPTRGRPRVNITKYRPGVIDRVRALMPENTAEYSVGDGVRFRLSSATSESLLEVVSGVGKHVSRDFVLSLTRSQLDLFLQSFVDIGDGGSVSTDTIRIWQTDKERLAAIELAALLAGRTVRWVKPIAEKTNAWGGISRECYGLTLSSRNRRWVQPHRAMQTREQYSGQVWCPTTGNQTWLARHDGKVFFTGNSNAKQVDEDLYKEHVEPLALVFVDAVLDIYLRPLLLAEQQLHPDEFTKDDVNKIVVWYDPSEITTKPDRGESANQGHDRMTVSDGAWRVAHGFSVTDAPSDDEVIRRLAIKNTPPPDILTAMFKSAFADFFKEAREANLGDAPLPPALQTALGQSGTVAPTALATPPPPAPVDDSAPVDGSTEPTLAPAPELEPASPVA